MRFRKKEKSQCEGDQPPTYGPRNQVPWPGTESNGILAEAAAPDLHPVTEEGSLYQSGPFQVLLKAQRAAE